MLQQPDLELNETVSKVAAVLTQAAITHLMSAHIKLEVLLELTDLGVFQGGGTHNVDQTPAEKYKAPQDQTLPHLLLLTYDIQTFDWAGNGHKEIDSVKDRFSLGKANPCHPTLSSLHSYFHSQHMVDALPKFRDQTHFKICSEDTNSSGSASPHGISGCQEPEGIV